MSNLARKLLLGLLLLPFSTIATAEVIHWELSSHDIPDYFDLEKGYTLSGGFDFNTANNAISNITVKGIAPTTACLLCNDFTGGTGEYFEHTFNDESTPPSVLLYEAYKTGDVVQRQYWLGIQQTIGLDDNDNPILTFKTPGTFSELSLDIEGWMRLDDPYDPDMDEHIGCIYCATAIGTLLPAVPEPETYALMLIGLLGIGWKVRSSRKDGFEMHAA